MRQTRCTDHAAWTREAKLDPSLTIANALPGMADLETLMPLLYSEGVRKGADAARFVEVDGDERREAVPRLPAERTVSVGSDADLAIWDTELTRTVHSQEGSRTPASASTRLGVTGWPVLTLSRGEIVYADGRIAVEHGAGRLVRCGPTLAA